jgi:hypothetical protein
MIFAMTGRTRLPRMRTRWRMLSTRGRRGSKRAGRWSIATRTGRSAPLLCGSRSSRRFRRTPASRAPAWRFRRSGAWRLPWAANAVTRNARISVTSKSSEAQMLIGVGGACTRGSVRVPCRWLGIHRLLGGGERPGCGWCPDPLSNNLTCWGRGRSRVDADARGSAPLPVGTGRGVAPDRAVGSRC